MKIGNVEINKKLFIALIIVSIIALIALIIKVTYLNRYEKHKIDKKKDYIYTYSTNDLTDTVIPYINLDSKDAKSINNTLVKISSLYSKNQMNNSSISYTYNVSNNYVSLLIIIRTIEDEKLKFSFDSYVFDLNDEARLLSNKEILALYNKDLDDINEKLEEEMRKKYDYEIEEEILPKSCDYNNCFLSLRNIDEYYDNANYYIEDGELVVYRDYNVYSEYNEQNYYTRDDFKFYIN
ncbi:MAG: hypothetical protein IKO49_06325 [Bacilli bacterium]|nr:hypothetical protein [Bacilli bacterium]